MNTLIEFYNFRKNGLKIVFLNCIFAIVTGYKGFEEYALFLKISFGGASILFSMSVIYTVIYFIKEFRCREIKK